MARRRRFEGRVQCGKSSCAFAGGAVQKVGSLKAGARNSCVSIMSEVAIEPPEPLLGCEDCNNDCDPVTLESFTELPPQYLFKVREENGVTHCFDIRSLHKYYTKTGKLENPLTRAVFSQDDLQAFLDRALALGLSDTAGAERMRDERTEQERRRDRQRELEDIRAALGDESHPELDMLIAGFDPATMMRPRRRGRRRRQEEDLSLLGVLGDNPIARAMARYRLDGADDILQRVGLPIGRRQHRSSARSPTRRSPIRRPPPPTQPKVRPSQEQFTTHEEMLAASRPKTSAPAEHFEQPAAPPRPRIDTYTPPPASSSYTYTPPPPIQPVYYPPVQPVQQPPMQQVQPPRTQQPIRRPRPTMVTAQAAPVAPERASSSSWMWLLLGLLIVVGVLLIMLR